MKAVASEALIVVSPFMIPMVIRLFWARQRNLFERVGKTLAIWVFWLSSLACLYIANFSWVLFWWNIVAFVLIFPFVGRYTTPIALWLHVGWGVLINTFATVTYAIVPVLLVFGIPPGMETEGVYGWPAIAERVRALKAEHGAEFVAANLSQPASQLAWALADAGVVAITPQRNGFDDWFDPSTRLGQDAIVVALDPEDEWKQSFESVRELETAPVVILGHQLRTYRIYLAEHFLRMQ